MTGGNHRRRLTTEKIGSRLKLIAPLVFRRSAPIETFRILPLASAQLDAPICADPAGWDAVPVGSYWGGADLNFVMKSGFTIPKGWDADRIALHLPLGILGDIFNHPEAMAYVDAAPIGSADRYHHTLPLDAGLADGRRHVLSLHGWTGHAGWPPDPTSLAKLHLGACSVVERDEATQAFVDLANVAYDSLSVIQQDAVRDAVLSALDQAFVALDTRDPLGEAFYASVPGALEVLRAGLARSGDPLDVTLHAIGHAHMDIAYLWPISQMRLKNARTYSNVLRLMEDAPDYRFSHSQPALYEMTAGDHPEIFARIKSRVAAGQWEVMGGMWVEPDLNVPGPEALVRQFTLGRSYFRNAFGDVETPVLWLPDTFGFPGQIPQLMAHAGLDWFVTNKLNWNQFNRVPWPTHIWEGIDGSRVKAHILTTPRDVQYLPFPTNYKSDLSAEEVMGTVTYAGESTALDLPICFGYGDGGGGPTESLLAKARIFQDFPGMPRIRFSTVREALAALEETAGSLPVWTGEHYLEGHRGVYTSQGWIKRANRKAERALHEAEALAAMAGQTPDLSEAWKLLCLNQFHDIITGTSVTEVFEDARRDYARILELTAAATTEASGALGLSELAVASVLPTVGPRVAETRGDAGGAGQPVADGAVLYFPEVAPYSITPTSAAASPDVPVTLTEDGDRIVLCNSRIAATFEAGQLVSLVEATTGREVIEAGVQGNRLLAFEDRPICWDAWDIDPHYEDRQEVIAAPVEVEVVETGPIRARLRLNHTWRNSRITQDVVLTADSPRLDFETTVDWNETHTLLKVAFPTTVEAAEAAFDIQWGMVHRATSRASDFDAARFEVPAQKWAMLSDPLIDVAVMNDCKYGYDVKDGTLRLTLIKSSTSPDPHADQGHHTFTYSLYAAPAGDLAARNHAAYDLNAPMRVIAATGSSEPVSGFVSADADNIVVETVKPGGPSRGTVLRLFECAGRDTVFKLRVPTSVQSVHMSDFWEARGTALPVEDSMVSLQAKPFEIMTLLLEA